MKLSTRARYALRMMVALAKHHARTDGSISLADISKRISISKRYLEQLVVSLRNAALVNGTVGKGGGYTLTRDAAEVTIAEIIESAIGPINIVDCVLRPETCILSESCECRWVYENINRRIVDALQGISLADLASLSDGAGIPMTSDDKMGCATSLK
jgi:Rrf2 family iron-sulfur cluster assembly transcriptional regulator